MTDSKEKRSTRIHEKVAEMLGMEMPENVEKSVVPMPSPHEVKGVDNPELPDLDRELQRLEHSQRQTEVLIDQGMIAIQSTFSDLMTMPAMYKPKHLMAAAELFTAVSALNQHRTDTQLKQVELKLKLTAFSRGRTGLQNITGNTIIFNREDFIKAAADFEKSQDSDDGD
jgi:hypothetical protein